MHVHILGICGTFMGGVAKLAKSIGYKVTGSDLNVYPPMSTQLESLGIELIEGYDPSQLAMRPDMIIIGNALTRGNPCVEQILSQQLPFTSGAAWVRDHILKDRWIIAVAGTHGKTSTSSMIAWILDYAGLNPGFLIGGVPENFKTSARIGDSPFFVIEADEYDTAFFDKRSKFVHYYPKTAVLNNLEFDHSDIFPNLAAIQTQFHHFVRTIPEDGLIIHPGKTAALEAVLQQGCWTPCETVGEAGVWQAKSEDAAGSSFTVLKHGQVAGQVNWSLMGEHNVLNALAAIAAAQHAGVPVEVAAEALSQFQNVKRRMEIKGIINDITLYDDFAHHPTAIKMTLEGLRAKVGTSARIIGILDIRSNTFKAGDLKEGLVEAVGAATECWIYQSSAVQWDVEAITKQMPVQAKVFFDTTEIVNRVKEIAQPGDHILIMSNGGFENIHQRIYEVLSENTVVEKA